MIEQSLFQKRLTQLFDITIFLKGIDGLLEIISGCALLFLTPVQIGSMAAALAQKELAEDPHDLLVNAMMKTLGNVTPHGQFVSTVFLLSHGVIKVFLVVQLFRGKLWAYPLTIIALLIFIIYQVVEIAHGHSLLLTSLTVLDAIIVILAWHEYKKKMATKAHASLSGALPTGE